MVAVAFAYLSPVQGALLQEAIDVAVILNARRALQQDDAYEDKTAKLSVPLWLRGTRGYLRKGELMAGAHYASPKILLLSIG
jgi:hypothetical protein